MPISSVFLAADTDPNKPKDQKAAAPAAFRAIDYWRFDRHFTSMMCRSTNPMHQTAKPTRQQPNPFIPPIGGPVAGDDRWDS